MKFPITLKLIAKWADFTWLLNQQQSGTAADGVMPAGRVAANGIRVTLYLVLRVYPCTVYIMPESEASLFCRLTILLIIVWLSKQDLY